MQVKLSRRRFLVATAQLGAGAAFLSRDIAQAFGQDEGIGRGLIGELEGPEVITDEAAWPTSFSEAPDLAARVSAGELPPVVERIGKHPLVIKPVHEIGRYGGTWRRAFTGPGDTPNGVRNASGPDNVLFFDYTAQNVVPNIARGWETSVDGKETLLFLREGMRWSDGEPFTANDFVFWFEDICQNREIVPYEIDVLSPNGKPGRVEKVDDYTVKLSFDESYSFIVEVLAGYTQLGGNAANGRSGGGLFAPAHYLKAFLPKYGDADKIAADAMAAGYDNWVLYFKAKSDWALNPDLPVVTPWKVTRPINGAVWEFERNPYSVWVDTAGNQLPYIDKISFGLAENLELVNLKAIAGEYDWQERHVDIRKLPVLLQNQQAQNYKVYIDPGDHGSDLMLSLNQSYDADPEIAKWLQNVNVRRALSLGIDRDELNEIFFLGLGQPRSIVPTDSNKYNPGAKYGKLWATHDVKKANALLDEAGLTEKDGAGYRLRTDGKGRLTFEIASNAGDLLPYGEMSEAIRTHWRAIGINATVAAGERSMVETRMSNNELQIHANVGDGADHLFTFPWEVIPVSAGYPNIGPLWGAWYASKGQKGVEPDAVMKEILAKYSAGLVASDEDRIRLGKEIFAALADNVYCIGGVGLSPAFGGIRVVKNTMGNVPARQYNGPDAKTSAQSRLMSVFFK
ncbi:ABC transporter substrate-binding protein [Mesorhizobium sp.]|uniref:ABC transporter substrate-binding protein n=1 Tax=Mesorhizobium sp. TaxID=1871066 RepID=UPI000FE9ACA8|nr:ABC transporter substrate-binding protein [Mesorhizobium sp.]RWK63386.1 MAG: ABC transporter substrate-binding protein [Mesorhizobium sp.]RWK63389.1 MAG: ABC transporter substrate-binding protein [Mesorhizobium sp.]